jgi:cyclase
MLRSRFIPVLLLKGEGLYKTVKFKNEVYIGDPINAVRVFNQKAVDEIILLDISANRMQQGPNFELIENIASEAFVPVCYGGGVSQLEQIERLFRIGIEKIAINSAATKSLHLISEAASIYGSQSIIVAIDVKRNLFGKAERYIQSGKLKVEESPVSFAKRSEDSGAGELLINCIDRDGTMSGYDTQIISEISTAVNIPVIACGGAGKRDDMIDIINKSGASSAAAGSLFVFHGKHRAVLISYLD